MSTALITGASTGLGREFARLCARDGHDLVLVARSATALEHLADEIRRDHKRVVRVVTGDLSVPDAALSVFEEVKDTVDSIDVLINNAGFGLLGPFAELDAAEQMQMIQLNVGALTQMTRLFLPGFLRKNDGHVLNIASTAAFQPGPLMAVYFATKAYVVSFSEALHNEVRAQGVTVTALCPGATKTEFDVRAGMGKSKLFARGNLMEARTVAEIGLRAMRRGKPLAVAGTLNAVMAFATRFAPRQMAASIAKQKMSAS